MECLKLTRRCGGAAEEISLLLKEDLDRMEANVRKIVLPSSVLGTLNDQTQPRDCAVGLLDSAFAAQSREIKQVHRHLRYRRSASAERRLGRRDCCSLRRAEDAGHRPDGYAWLLRGRIMARNHGNMSAWANVQAVCTP